MSSVPVIVGGAAKDAVPSVIIGGAEKKIYDAYVMIAGAAKLVYKSAVGWTHTITEVDSRDSVSDANHTLSLFCYFENQSYSHRAAIDYIFSEPLVLLPGSSISYSFIENFYGSSYEGYVYLTVNEQAIMDHAPILYNLEQQGTLSYPSGITLNHIWMRVGGYGEYHVTITVNPAGGTPFTLTFLDSAEQ